MDTATAKTEALVHDMVSSMPTVYFKLREALDNPSSTFKDFEDIIRKDPGLVVRLLKIVNSAFYGLSEQVETISRALMIVGIEQLSELVLSTSIGEMFKGIPKELIDMKTFLRHSICCGMAAKIMADYKRMPNSEGFYTAGMLHDIGSLVIFKKRPNQAREVLLTCKSQNAPLTEVEQKILGFDHTQAGGALLKAWKLPILLQEAALWHHAPSRSTTHRPAVGIVHAADFVSYRMNGNTDSGIPYLTLNNDVIAELGFSETYLSSLEQNLKKPFEAAVKAFL